MDSHIEYICIKEDPDGDPNEKSPFYRLISYVEKPISPSVSLLKMSERSTKPIVATNKRKSTNVLDITKEKTNTELEVVEVESSSTNDEPNNLPPDTTSKPSMTLLSRSFKGDYGFDIYFEPTKSEFKNGATWIYCKTQDKLYVSKDLPCPIGFVTKVSPPSNAKIRVMAVFSQSHFANEVVRRCINHSFMDLNKGVINPDHLIRCDNVQTVYETDDLTERKSLIFPYEYISDGNEQYGNYIFNFKCYGSCAGGLNRRPIKIIFTLEINKQVVGRRSLDVRICASPWRDAKHEKDKFNNSIADGASGSAIDDDLSSPIMKKRKHKEISSSKDDESTHPFADVLDFINKLNGDSSSKKSRLSSDDESGTYAIVVSDPEEYEFLKQAKQLYEMHKTIQSIPSKLLKYLKGIQKRKMEISS